MPYTAPNNLRDTSRAFVSDDFITGTNANGGIGSAGWAVAGGTTSVLAAEASHPGLIRRNTGTTSDTITTVTARTTATTGVFVPADLFDLTWIVRLNTNDSATILRVGAGNDMTANAPADGLYLEKLAADTNWFFVTRASSTQTRVDSGVACSTNFIRVRIRRLDASTIGFSIDGGAETLHTTNIPTAALQPGTQIINSGVAAAKTMDLDYFDLLITGMSR